MGYKIVLVEMILEKKGIAKHPGKLILVKLSQSSPSEYPHVHANDYLP